MLSNKINIQDILPDREIIKMQNQNFAGLEYERWRVSTPLFSDETESLIENGFMVSVFHNGEVFVHKQLNPSPTQLRENKQFWCALNKELES